MATFKKQIKKVNPGRLIDVRKICPHLKTECIKTNCNAFAFHNEINIVSLEEKIQEEKNGHDWEKILKINDWKLHAISKSTIGPDEQDSLYIRVVDPEKTGQGRCKLK